MKRRHRSVRKRNRQRRPRIGSVTRFNVLRKQISGRPGVVIGGRNLKRYKNGNQIQNVSQPMLIEIPSTSRVDAR
jgi:hypothetical protein